MNALRHVDLTRVFFVGIATVPGYATHAEMPVTHQALWKKFCERRHARELAAGYTQAELFAHGGLYAEFGKVVCISVSFFRELKDDTLEFCIKSFASDNEGHILRDFAQFLHRYTPYGPSRHAKLETAGPDGYFLCAHNGRAFDYSYLGRRLLVCGQEIPPLLDVAGHQPNDLPHLLDTLELWQFGDRQNDISLALLAGAFGISSPQQDGAPNGHIYWLEKDLARIVKHCEQDTTTTARILLHYTGQQELWPAVTLSATPWPAPAIPIMQIVA